MDIASAIYIFTLIFYASSKPSDYIESDYKLKLVHVVSNSLTFTSFHFSEFRKNHFSQIFRHGARTPADTFPTDPHINNTMEPYGWGELTNVS
jgi:hypothetical protein